MMLKILGDKRRKYQINNLQQKLPFKDKRKQGLIHNDLFIFIHPNYLVVS